MGSRDRRKGEMGKVAGDGKDEMKGEKEEGEKRAGEGKGRKEAGRGRGMGGTVVGRVGGMADRKGR